MRMSSEKCYLNLASMTVTLGKTGVLNLAFMVLTKLIHPANTLRNYNIATKL